jgi:hypothetical protein
MQVRGAVMPTSTPLIHPPQPTATAAPAKEPALQGEYIVFAACMALILVAFVVTLISRR